MPILIFSLLGPDRPGLVEQLAQIVADHEGNWLESRLVRLGGQFAGVARARLASDERAEALSQALGKLSPELEVIVRSESEEVGENGTLFELSLQAQDRPGIVREVSAALNRLGVNVEELHSEAVDAPMSGEVLFHLDAILRLPAERSAAELQQALEALSDDLVVDLEPVEL